MKRRDMLRAALGAFACLLGGRRPGARAEVRGPRSIQPPPYLLARLAPLADGFYRWSELSGPRSGVACEINGNRDVSPGMLVELRQTGPGLWTFQHSTIG